MLQQRIEQQNDMQELKQLLLQQQNCSEQLMQPTLEQRLATEAHHVTGTSYNSQVNAFKARQELGTK